LPETTREALVVESLLTPQVKKHLVDIGARLRGSNSRHFIEKLKFGATLVEKNPQSADELRRTFPKATVYQMFCTPENVNRFVTDDCGILFIDIDGNDWHVWEAVKVSPPIVVIEVAPKCPYEDRPYVSAYNRDNRKRLDGANHLAFVELGLKKGYRLHDRVGVNAIFVHETFVQPAT
jgi:hypothetical protein